MDKYLLRAAWLYYNETQKRWLLAATDEEMIAASLFVLPPDTDPAEGFEARRRTESLHEPCCPLYQGRCLCSIEVSRHGTRR